MTTGAGDDFRDNVLVVGCFGGRGTFEGALTLAWFRTAAGAVGAWAGGVGAVAEELTAVDEAAEVVAEGDAAVAVLLL